MRRPHVEDHFFADVAQVLSRARVGRGDARHRVGRFDFAGDKCHGEPRDYARERRARRKRNLAAKEAAKLQIPSSKHQRSSKSQHPKAKDGRCVLGAWRLKILWSLELGIWSFARSAAPAPGGGWGFRRQNSATPPPRATAAGLTYFNSAQYGVSPTRSCFAFVGFLNVTNSTRPLLMSLGRTESALRRQFMAALRASSSNAGWPLLRSTLVPVTRPLLSSVRDNTTDPCRP